ncbi:MAG: NUDIX domain-containing protein [Bacteroidetes bacterium]|jgi:ADP-ribose pyrophosphatase YjhB (NUDIX family)|nr:NUDIX domain-containing protein [Bacteroidota bacterium]MBT6684982.1 NUDIX domain-containing protein [Bacteroidota bacterium]MBT7143060.1 NUDIX domain-containing protein [Bacteroidota bacterium]MBT7491527.1 NUDIX domain-containing protein [Bacteroidota bacterium]
MQKYKVFFNSRIVYLSQTKLKNIDQYYKFENKEKLFEEIEIFILNEKMNSLNVIGNDLENLFENFKSYFSEIEAAGGIVKNEKDEILFIFRLAKWDLPKGKIENNETPERAAIREVEEECGISNLRISSKLQNSYHIYFLKAKYILKKTYWFEMEYSGNENLIPQTEEDITDARWFNKKMTQTVLDNTYDSLIDIIKEATKGK